VRVGHDARVRLVDEVEGARLLWELLAYVAHGEDAVEVHPLALGDHPDLQDFPDEGEVALPGVHGINEWTDEPEVFISDSVNKVDTGCTPSNNITYFKTHCNIIIIITNY